MPIPSPSSLIPADSASINLARLALYQTLKGRAVAAREQYAKLHKQVNALANLYFDEFPEQHDYVKYLRREIRIATRGVPTDIGTEDLFESAAISQGVTERLYAAQRHMVKKAFRLLASVVHQDHSKYDASLFQQVKRAYEQNDLVFLQELYLVLKHEPDLFWRQTQGIEFWKQEIERPTVSLRVLQTSPEFQISRAHMSGRPDLARELARVRLAELIYQLDAEWKHLLTEYRNRGNQTLDTS